MVSELHQACETGDVATVRRLLAEGADVNATDEFGGYPLHDAAWHGHLEVAQMLIAQGANLNAREGWAMRTPAEMALKQGHFEVFEAIMRAGADPNALGGLGGNLVHACARTIHGDLRFVQVALALGGDPEWRDQYGSTPVMEAARYQQVELMELLARLPVQLDVHNIDGQSFWDIAVDTEIPEVIECARRMLGK